MASATPSIRNRRAERMSDDDQTGSSDDLEIHPLNPAAVRRPGGYWTEESVPVTDWESPEHRVVLPWHLQQHLGSTGPVLRWADAKRHTTLTRRPADAHVANSLSHYLDTWQFVGLEKQSSGSRNPNPARRFRVLLRDETARWYAISIGPDANGSDNLITLVGSGDRLFLANRLRGMENIMKRGK